MNPLSSSTRILALAIAFILTCHVASVDGAPLPEGHSAGSTAPDCDACVDSVGVVWKNLTLDQALDSAAAQGKKVFLDCYTKTCGPCRMMVSKIFPLPECGAHINPRYVPVMMDMEEGEGPSVGSRYKVSLYPTYLLLNPDGSLYAKLEGGASKTSEIFLKKLAKAESIGALAQRYDAGERTPGLMRDYAIALKPLQSTRSIEILTEYLLPLATDSLATETNLNAFVRCITVPQGQLYRRIIEQRHELAEAMGKENFDSFIATYFNNFISTHRRIERNFMQYIPDVQLLQADGNPQAAAIISELERLSTAK